MRILFIFRGLGQEIDLRLRLHTVELILPRAHIDLLIAVPSIANRSVMLLQLALVERGGHCLSLVSATLHELLSSLHKAHPLIPLFATEDKIHRWFTQHRCRFFEPSSVLKSHVRNGSRGGKSLWFQLFGASLQMRGEGSLLLDLLRHKGQCGRV